MSRGRHPIFARLYARFSPGAERAGTAEHRRELLAGLAGRVIEVGCGNGLNFAHYPPAVTDVLAVEPEPYLRARAAEAARAAPVPVRVAEGRAERLPAPSDSFDAAVASLVLCSVSSQVRALAEVARVLRAGGELRFYEHVRAPDERRARMQHRVDALWPRLFGGCHTSRDTPAAIARAGFRIERIRRFEFAPTRAAFPASPHVLGVAVRTEEAAAG